MSARRNEMRDMACRAAALLAELGARHAMAVGVAFGPIARGEAATAASQGEASAVLRVMARPTKRSPAINEIWRVGAARTRERETSRKAAYCVY